MGIICKENEGKTMLQDPEWQYEHIYFCRENQISYIYLIVCSYGNPPHMSKIT